jgi:hypothetical protein
VRTDIAAATDAATAATEDYDNTETDDHPGSLSSVNVRTPARGSKLPATTKDGQAERMPSGLLGTPSLPIHVRHIAQAHRRAQRQWRGENLAVAYARGQARCWTAMRRQCPESGCARGRVQVPVMH